MAVLPSEDASTGMDLAALLGCLTAPQRRAVELTKIEGLSVVEVSEKMGLSVSAVKVTVHRAMKSLKKKLKEDASSEGQI